MVQIKKDKISVVIRTRNEERWIGHVIQSVIDHLDKPEIIIVDNNSTNGIYINDEIKSVSELKSGDKIQIGKYLLLLTEVKK